jgi:PAS domain S-box-containing protein
MNVNRNSSQHAEGMRQRAEEIARQREAQTPGRPDAPSSEEARQALHELRVHQIELEMQNEELRRVQAELETSRARYFDLYDLAPMGYFTLSETGMILESNLRAAAMLGVNRITVVKHPLSHFLLPEDQDIYYQHHRKLVETGERHVCELRMLRAGAAPFWTRLEESAIQGGYSTPSFLVVASDITESKRADMERQIIEAHLLQAQKMESGGIGRCRQPDASGYTCGCLRGSGGQRQRKRL